jgi:hypothetical protein
MPGSAAHRAEPFVEPVVASERLGQELLERQSSLPPAVPAPRAQALGTAAVMVTAGNGALAVIENGLGGLHSPHVTGRAPTPSH